MWFLQAWIILGVFLFVFCALLAVVCRVFEEDDDAARAAARWAVYLLFWPLLLLSAPYFVYKWGWGEEDERIHYRAYYEFNNDNPENNEKPRMQWWEMLKRGN